MFIFHEIQPFWDLLSRTLAKLMIWFCLFSIKFNANEIGTVCTLRRLVPKFRLVSLKTKFCAARVPQLSTLCPLKLDQRSSMSLSLMEAVQAQRSAAVPGSHSPISKNLRTTHELSCYCNKSIDRKQPDSRASFPYLLRFKPNYRKNLVKQFSAEK